MRRFILLMLACYTVCISSTAQITILDAFKKKNPISTDKVVGWEQTAFTPELSIIRQQYRLERKGEFYGKNNMSYYGETYTLAIKVSGGTYLSGNVIEPWKYDADYQRVNADNKYKPVYFWSYQRALNDSVYKAVELDLDKEYTKPVNADKSLWLHEDVQRDFGLTEDKTAGKKKGTLIWAYANTNVQDSAMKVDLRQVPMQVELKGDSTVVPVEVQDAERVIGGLYVVPKYERGGRVQFLLAGVAVKDADSKWCLQMLVVPSGITPTNSSVDAEKKEKTGKKKDRKKETSSEPTPTKSK